jgi:RNA polymerase subunit RPABC4/transcription elongation factor Spt4
MQSEAHKNNQRSSSNAEAQNTGNCPNCHALMPRELRFCRSCGCRLGEGVEEYTETVRFQDAPAATTARRGKSRTASAKLPGTSPADMKEFKAMAHRIHDKTVSSVTSGLGKWKIKRACNRVPRWMVWVIIPIMIASMTGGFRNSMRSRNRSSSAAVSSAQNSFLGAEYKTAQGGAMIMDVSPPGSAADKAGLIGGDVITSFDGKAVKSEEEMTRFLTATPIGKTVDVVYTRDGETKTAKLTTVSEEENDRFAETFRERPEGNGFLGVNDEELNRVKIPEMNIYGVQVNEVYKNRPAYIAGLRDGDIVIEFDKAPIRTEEEFNKRIDRALPDSTITIKVVRSGQRIEIPVKMGVE